MANAAAQRTRRRRVLVAALATIALVLGAVAIADEGGADSVGTDFDVPEGVEPLGDIRAGSVASLVDCDDWSGGSTERKRATVVDIREQLSSGGTIEGRPSLTDQEAYDTFERACGQSFTGAFRLYKIYYQANAFENFAPSVYENVPAG